jgi:hypothetical protein
LCGLLGLLALLWLYLVDLMRRNLPTDDGDYHLITVFYLGISAAFLGMFFCQICVNIRPPSEVVAAGRISS